MRLKDILLETPTDIVARFYKEAGKDLDRYYNPDDVKYKAENAEYYKKHFEDWYKSESVPVLEKPVDKPQPEYTTKPKEGKLQSPGYRGLNYAKAAAGLPYDKKVQQYKTDPYRAVASQTMDGARNNNGQ